MEVVSSLLLLIDRGISLIKQRETRNQAIVKEIIEPMFGDLQGVHNDYILLFQKLIDGISNERSEEKVRAAARTFSQERVQYLALRQKLRVLAESYKSSLGRDPLLNEFFSAVTYVVGLPGQMSISLILEVLLHSVLQQEGAFVSDADLSVARLDTVPPSLILAPDSMNRIIRNAIEMQRRTEQSWEQACEHYAAIKVSYSVPK
jgi:hypothetical protein